jgi:TolB-like protein/DNA-binding winged helix-turn-helix (wHTH) protein/Tfp pilus assembly protein PilF
VATSAQPATRLRFDTFETDLHSGEVWKNGNRLRLQDQPFQVLRLLLERHGQIVTREELRQRLWPADTFVDFDDSLNTAVKKIRDLLGDSADRPHYIETIPRRGYRFIAAVEIGQAATLEQKLPVLEQRVPEHAIKRWSATQRRWVAAGFTLAFALIALSAWVYRLRSRSDATSVRAIAVLPLENLSGDPSQDYFAAGLTDTLTTELAHTVGNSLRVTSRISAEKYKNKPLAQIARELNVDAVVEGSVIRSGNRARITVQLINARADKHLWAAIYDRDLHDMLSLQSEIAASVARQVQITLSPRIETRLRGNQTVDPEAYDLYQRSLLLGFSNNKQEMAAAVGLLQQALARDPNFAAAHALLAREYTNQVFLLQPRDPELEVKAIQEIDQALKLDPDLAVAYLARGVLLWSHRNGFPHERAIAQFKRALELDPNLAEAHHQLGMIYSHIGLLDRADHELRTALDLEPTSIAFRYRIAINFFDEGRFEEARIRLQSTQSFNPDLWAYQMALVLFKLGQKQEALALIRDFLRDNPNDRGGLGNGVLALLYADTGQGALAQASIETALQKGKDFGHFHHTAYAIGSAYAVMHRGDEAVHWLRAAADDGFPCYPLFEHDSNLDHLRNDPGFLRFLAEQEKQWEYFREHL